MELMRLSPSGHARMTPLIRNSAVVRCTPVADLSASLNRVLVEQEFGRLYSAPTVGRTRQQITVEPVPPRARFSPDGSKLTFETDRPQVFVVGPAGASPRQVSDDAAFASWAPDSRRLAFIGHYSQPLGRRASGMLTVANVDGSGRRELDTWRATASQTSAPVWDPTGKWIAFTTAPDDGSSASTPDIHIVSVDGSSRRIIHAADAPTWSPDGSRLAFLAGAPSFRSLRVQPRGGGRQRVVASNAEGPPAWSPTGGVIAYPARSRARLALAVVNASGTNRHLLGTNPKRVKAIDRIFWSADGKQLAFLRESEIVD